MRPVIVTRPEPEGARTAAALAARGVPAMVWPLTRIVLAGGPVAVPEGTEALLFTSANGVRGFAAGSARRDLPALCVGGRTAEAARAAGFGDVRTAEGDAAALVRLALADGARRFLHVRGETVAGDVAGALGAGGCDVAEAVVYGAEPADTVPAEVDAALAAGGASAIGLWSPRNARLFAEAARAHPGWRLAALEGVAISAAAAGPLDGLGLSRVAVAARPDGEAMLDALTQAAERDG